MKLTAYVQRQKNLIRSRHAGGTYLSERDSLGVCERDRLLAELENLKGLNKAERLCRRGFERA